MFGFGKTKLSSYVTESVSEELIRLDNLVKIYDTGAIKVLGLKKINLTIRRGEFVAIMGHSGSGKSTLMNILGCLDRPTLGHYYLDGIDTADLSPNELSAVRNLKIGFVFQSYNLLSTLTALENVTLPLIFRKVPTTERNKRAMKMLEAVGLSERAHHKPSEMSGGQQQRVSIARAFINSPQVVFADEPTGNLDTKTTYEMMDLITSLAQKNKQTLVIVTHDLEISEYADRIIHLSDGKIEKIEQNQNKRRAKERRETQ